jgi:hypothetical protein
LKAFIYHLFSKYSITGINPYGQNITTATTGKYLLQTQTSASCPYPLPSPYPISSPHLSPLRYHFHILSFFLAVWKVK